MTGSRQTALVSTLLAGLVLATAPAAAQQIPLPTPGPQPRSGAVPPPSESIPSARPGAQAQPAKPGGSSWLPSFLGGAPSAPPKARATVEFTAQQRALVDKVSAYLSRVHIMSGEFAQIGADGRRSNGNFYLQKPGKVRFEYDPPSPIDIIADGSSVVVRDRRLATQDLYPLSQTPLRFLLADKIDLLRDTHVTAVTADELFVSIVVEEKQALIGTSRLMMMFDAKTLELRQWVVTDPQGFDTTIAVSNLDSSRRPDPSLFRIDYTDYRRDR
ncbi:MAG: outer membrane lipoprotein carrier protein LolA [Rhizobiales bacterium]|nr:outer membrane lipoprotein carrier protein LolA [Hyphomicrobiales bacterium]